MIYPLFVFFFSSRTFVMRSNPFSIAPSVFSTFSSGDSLFNLTASLTDSIFSSVHSLI